MPCSIVDLQHCVTAAVLHRNDGLLPIATNHHNGHPDSVPLSLPFFSDFTMGIRDVSHINKMHGLLG